MLASPLGSDLPEVAAQVGTLSQWERGLLLRLSVSQLAAAILHDHEGDALMAEYLRLSPLLHNYGVVNRFLIAMQRQTRQAASRTAWNRLARSQGHAGIWMGLPGALHGKTYACPREGCLPEYRYDPNKMDYACPHGRCKEEAYLSGKRDPSRCQHENCRAISILIKNGACRKVKNPETGEESFVNGLVLFGAVVFAVEDMVYADTGEPLEFPDFVPDFADAARKYYEPLCRFLAGEGIGVDGQYLGHVRGASFGGRIVLQVGDPQGKKFGILCHEAAHELMHRAAERNTFAAHLLEGEAEATACVVLQYFGCASMSPSAAYLRNWGVRPERVIGSMDAVVRTAEKIVRGIEREADKGAGWPCLEHSVAD